MKICFADKSNIHLTNKDFEFFLEKKGHTVTHWCEADYDLIFNMSHFNFQPAKQFSDFFPDIPVVNWVWDYYKFAHEGRHMINDKVNDWTPYVDFLKRSKLIIACSSGVQKGLKDLLGLDSQVILTGMNCKDMETRDGRFVLDHMRWYPEENEKWVVNACDELGIKSIHPNHRFHKEMFDKMLANCTFTACGYRDVSTGGLTVIEGLWNGKTALLSNSPYAGGSDYMKHYGTYFQYDDYEDCKRKIQETFENPPKINIKEARDYIRENFSYELMADNLEKAFESL